MSQYSDRIRLQSLTDKITTAEEAAKLVKNGNTVGMQRLHPRPAKPRSCRSPCPSALARKS